MEQIIAATILAGGAFFGVWKGAVYAVDRLSAQLAVERRLSEERLDAEAERLQMQLNAEAKRLERQLEHDRTMRDRDAVRTLLDEGVKLAFECGDLAGDYQLRLKSEPPREPEAEPRLVQRRLVLILAMSHFRQRLLIRYPFHAEVSKAFFALYMEFHSTCSEAHRLLMDESLDDDESVCKRLDGVSGVREAFLKACNRQVGVGESLTQGSEGSANIPGTPSMVDRPRKGRPRKP